VLLAVWPLPAVLALAGVLVVVVSAVAVVFDMVTPWCRWAAHQRTQMWLGLLRPYPNYAGIKRRSLHITATT
jgi:hypothetical protein